MGQKLANNAFATLDSAISAGDTTIVLTTGHGSRFPSLSAGEYFYATLDDLADNIEIVKVTARVNDTLTVVRGQDGTTAKAYQAGTIFELRPTRVLIQAATQEASVAILLSGTNNYSGTLSPVPQAYETNQVYWFRFSNTNTSSGTTVELSGLGEVDLRRRDGGQFLPGEIPTGVALPFSYTGSQFRALFTSFAYLRDGSLGITGSLNQPWLTTGGTSTAYTITPESALSGYVAGHSYLVQFHVACGANPTLQISGLASPPNLVKRYHDGTFGNLAAGDVPAGWRSRVTLISATQALVEEIQSPEPFALPSSHPTVPDWKTNPNSQIANWAQFSKSLNLLVENTRKHGLLTCVPESKGSFPSGGAFRGCVLLLDGRVFCVPANSTTARIYNPATDTVSTPSGTYPGSEAFSGGVLLRDGRVFCIPWNSTTARIYNPATNTVSTPSGTYPGSQAFEGGVLLSDGRVFLAPRTSTTARIYDPATDTLTTPSGTYPGGGAFIGAVLLPDGRVFLVPFTSTTARIYNPATDTLTTPSGTYPGGSAFVGGVLLADGRVFCVPYHSTTARIYDPVTDTLTTPSGTYPGSGDPFYGGVLLPDGRVFIIPSHSTTARIYDPITDTVTTPPGTYPGSGAIVGGGVLLPDGRVFCAPYNMTTAMITTGTPFVRVPSGICTSPFFNKF